MKEKALKIMWIMPRIGLWSASDKGMLVQHTGDTVMRVNKVLVLAALSVLPMMVAMPVMANDNPVPQISVTGEGRVEARPDMATISMGVTSEAQTAAEAMSANAAQLGEVLDNLRAAGIEDRDLQTSGLSLNPNWNHNSNDGAPRIQGYVASNQLTVRVRTLEKLGMILDAAVKDGANTLNGVSFGVTNPEPLLDEARKRAVADARRRAELLTEAAGVELGKVLSIAEGGGYTPPQPQFRMAEGMMADSVPVAEGEVSLSVSVTLVWGIGD